LPRRFILAVSLLSLLLATASEARAAAETWLCPVCQVERIQRPEGATDLTCPKCGLTLPPEDLRWRIAYVALGSRPSSVVWDLLPECGIFRNDGLMAYQNSDSL
jgi:hypothetical protein